jgi:peroxiredoxin
VSRLHNGQHFPSLSLPAVGGGTVSLPDDLAGSFGVVLIYRGSRASETLADLNAKVVALSVDDESTSAALVEKHKLTFPVAHSADPDTVSKATGAYVSADHRYLQSSGFVLDPQGNVITAVYSSEAIGRLVADDVIGFLRYLKAHEG